MEIKKIEVSNKGVVLDGETLSGGFTAKTDWDFFLFDLKESGLFFKITSITTTIFSNSGSFAVWGAGAKGSTFLNLLDKERKAVKYVIDINPAKQNKFIARKNLLNDTHSLSLTSRKLHRVFFQMVLEIEFIRVFVN